MTCATVPIFDPEGQFIAVNCAALSATLIESELFGYTGSAFTGANQKGATGLIRKAHKGTLFLDEIGEMPFELQAKLLRFLDQWKVRPIGAVQEQALDIQLVSAANCNLREAIEKQQFRSDLYYRINTVSLKIPPLRERSDIAELIET